MNKKKYIKKNIQKYYEIDWVMGIDIDFHYKYERKNVK